MIDVLIRDMPTMEHGPLAMAIAQGFASEFPIDQRGHGIGRSVGYSCSLGEDPCYALAYWTMAGRVVVRFDGVRDD